METPSYAVHLEENTGKKGVSIFFFPPSPSIRQWPFTAGRVRSFTPIDVDGARVYNRQKMSPNGMTVNHGPVFKLVVNTIFVDLGNVLVFFDHKIVCEKLAQHSPDTPEQIYEKIFTAGLEAAFDEGRFDPHGFYQAVKQTISLDLSYGRFLPAWEEVFLSANTTVVALIHRLRRQYPVWLVSNTNTLHFLHVQSRFPGVLDPLSGHVLSYRIGRRKPDRVIYEAALAMAGAEASRSVFIDDMALYVEEARRLGFHGVLYRDPQQLERELTALVRQSSERVERDSAVEAVEVSADASPKTTPDRSVIDAYERHIEEKRQEREALRAGKARRRRLILIWGSLFGAIIYIIRSPSILSLIIFVIVATVLFIVQVRLFAKKKKLEVGEWTEDDFADPDSATGTESSRRRYVPPKRRRKSRDRWR